MNAARTRVNKALWLTLGAGIVGWALFELSVFSNLAIDVSLSPDDLWGPNAIAIVRPATYLLFAAITVLGVGGLMTKRLVSRSDAEASALSTAVRDFASTVLIVAMVMSAVSAISVFMGNLFEGVSEATILERIFISYLPIVLYTALVVTLLLAGFVFAKRPAAKVQQSNSAPVHSSDTEHAGSVQRSTAVAYTVPIVAVAAALIFGLIVYDITQTALEAWIWVIVQVIVGTGIVVGTVFAARALTAVRVAGGHHSGASVGAKVLNFVLSIIFVGVVTGMSLGYGASAIEKLRFQPSLSISAYSNDMEQKEPGGNVDIDANISDVRVFVNGSSLDSGTDLVVTFEPGAIEIVTEQVNANGWASAEFSLPEDLPAKSGAIQLNATDAQGNQMTLELEAVVSSDGTITMESTYVDFTTDDPAMLSATAGWVLDDLLPPLVLLLSVIALLYITLNARNPEVGQGSPAVETLSVDSTAPEA